VDAEFPANSELCRHCKQRPARPRGYFCSRDCRQRAYRRRRVRLPEDAYNGEQGGWRGRARLGAPTEKEQAARLGISLRTFQRRRAAGRLVEVVRERRAEELKSFRELLEENGL
jgi:hypothetical protein